MIVSLQMPLSLLRKAFPNGATWQTDDGVFAFGGKRASKINGSDGDDMLIGGAGNDIIRTGGGDDLVYAGGGNDRVFVQGGQDTVYGGAGRDLIIVQDGVGHLFGGAGSDTLQGGAGDDTLEGGAGFDILYGGDSLVDEFGNPSDSANGADTFVFRSGDLTATPDRIEHWGADDRIVINVGGVSEARQVTGGEWADRFAVIENGYGSNTLMFDHDGNAGTAMVAVALVWSLDGNGVGADQVWFA
jgi:Ca2+-binding RTX toxin-like protein